MTFNLPELPRTPFIKQTCYRLIPSKFPPISLFDDVADNAEFDALYAVQALTNPRLQLGNLSRVPEQERVFGISGAGYVMAAFTHVNPDGSRFSNGEFGVYYGAASLTTAITETQYHRQRFMSYTQEPEQELDMRCLVADFSAGLVDIRAEKYRATELYHPEDYSVARRLGWDCKIDGRDGITYNSVRDAEGQSCFALFKPNLIDRCVQASHFGYVWDGEKISTVYKKSLDFDSP